jgi:hypothetical protein
MGTERPRLYRSLDRRERAKGSQTPGLPPDPLGRGTPRSLRHCLRAYRSHVPARFGASMQNCYLDPRTQLVLNVAQDPDDGQMLLVRP